MRITSTYKVKIRGSHGVFLDTAKVYRQAVDFLIGVVLKEWGVLEEVRRPLETR